MSNQGQIRQDLNQDILQLEHIIQQLKAEIDNINSNIRCPQLAHITIRFLNVLIEIEFFSKNIIFLLDIKFLSLKIARDSDENCGFHLRKCAKIFFSKNNMSNVVVVATFIRLTPNFRRRSSDNIEKFDIL